MNTQLQEAFATMRLHLAALLVAAAATFAGPGSNRAEAQAMTGFGAPIVETATISPMPAIGGGIVADPAPRFPYSYYAAFPTAAREYVPYGPNDMFPFHGTPYGRPYDRWTWAYMTGPPSNLQRYYYPPVR
jgi:hypothetical protein